MDDEPAERLPWYVVFPWEYGAAAVVTFGVLVVLNEDASGAVMGVWGASMVGGYQQRRRQESALRSSGEPSDRRAVLGPLWVNIVIAALTMLAVSGVGVALGAVFTFDGSPPRPLDLEIGAILFGAAVVGAVALVVVGRTRRRRRADARADPLEPNG